MYLCIQLKENLQFIKNKDIENILNQDCSFEDKARNLVRFIHQNDNVPENRNFFMEPLYGTFIPFVYREDGWKEEYDEKFIPNLINHKKKMLLVICNMWCKDEI